MYTTSTSKAHEAIGRYLELRGYEIVEDGWAHGQDAVDFIARDGEDGALVFVTAQTCCNEGEGVPESEPDRKSFERIAAAFLTEADVTDCAVRLDAISLLLLNGSRGLIRHHVNVLSRG